MIIIPILNSPLHKSPSISIFYANNNNQLFSRLKKRWRWIPKREIKKHISYNYKGKFGEYRKVDEKLIFTSQYDLNNNEIEETAIYDPCENIYNQYKYDTNDNLREKTSCNMKNGELVPYSGESWTIAYFE